MSYLIPLCLRKGSLGTFKSFAQVPSAWTPQGQCPLHLGRWPLVPTPVLLADVARLWKRFPALLLSRAEGLHCRRKLLGLFSPFSESVTSTDRAFPAVAFLYVRLVKAWCPPLLFRGWVLTGGVSHPTEVSLPWQQMEPVSLLCWSWTEPPSTASWASTSFS